MEDTHAVFLHHRRHRRDKSVIHDSKWFSSSSIRCFPLLFNMQLLLHECVLLGMLCACVVVDVRESICNRCRSSEVSQQQQRNESKEQMKRCERKEQGRSACVFHTEPPRDASIQKVCLPTVFAPKSFFGWVKEHAPILAAFLALPPLHAASKGRRLCAPRGCLWHHDERDKHGSTPHSPIHFRRTRAQ